ncbi:MAG: hypothetical protein AAGB00_06655 [Planctomycetota bacterium]
MNLECADKLPGSERLDIPKYVAVLDDWARLVAQKTEQYLPKFQADPSDYHESEAYFRMLVLVTVLQRDLGVAYAKKSLEKYFDATDSRLHFLHGIIEGVGRTCATMPVLYIAIGRRLRYPLRLVEGVGHLFVRWDDDQTEERFNIESTSEGLNVRPDSYYHTWPSRIVEKHVREGWLLKSMSPREELSVFYETRCRCFFDWMHWDAAIEMAHHACELAGGEANPYRGGVQALVSLVYNEYKGLVSYRLLRNGKGVAVEKGRERPMLSWEAWAAKESRQQLERVNGIHAERRRNRLPHIASKSVIQLESAPSRASDAYFEQEALSCTTQK